MTAIRYVITKDGEVVFDFEGFRGKVCDVEAEKIIEGLKKLGVNIEMKDRQNKPEYYTQEVVHEY